MLRLLPILILLSIQTVYAQNSVFRHPVNDGYIGFKLNYGFRPLLRDASTLEIGIDSTNNEFGTHIYDVYKLKAIDNMKGVSFGIEYGSSNIFGEGQIDFALRNKTYLISTNIFLGYNFTFLEKHPVAIRPAVGVNYNWLWTELGSYTSNDPEHKDIYLTQSNALAGIRPRLQIEIPVLNVKEDGIVFLRVEAGYQFSTYTSRFIKLKAERTYANSNGKTKSDSERFYLDGENSGYYINGKHMNKTPTSFYGLYYSIELAIKIMEF